MKSILRVLFMCVVVIGMQSTEYRILSGAGKAARSGDPKTTPMMKPFAKFTRRKLNGLPKTATEYAVACTVGVLCRQIVGIRYVCAVAQ